MRNSSGITADNTYLYDSLTWFVDNDWQRKLEQHPECKSGGFDLVHSQMDQILLIRFPLSVRLIENTRESEFLSCLHSLATNAQLNEAHWQHLFF